MYVIMIILFIITHSLSLHLSCIHVFWYISLLSLIPISLPFIDGDIWDHTDNKVGDCEGVGEGGTVMMEVDLRGEGRERTLHFFISGRQQKTYFYNLPSTVEFCVCHHHYFIFYCFSLILVPPIIIFLLLFSSISIMLIRSVLSLSH